MVSNSVLKIVIITIVFNTMPILSAQCLSGNCNDGKGKYDFGFAVYEGDFKNGKPEGQGTMDYGGGERFSGSFKNGQEGGDGILYKNNIPQYVTYVRGTVQVRQVQNHVGSNAPKVKGCLEGDCINGFGIVKYDSGNSFEGQFKDGLIGDSGKFIYKNGNYYEGKFVNELNTEGKYYFAHENVTYNGTFYNNGKERTGVYYYPVTEATVKIVDGEITEVHNPVAEKVEAAIKEMEEQGMVCRKCNGKGMSGGGSYVQKTQSYYDINYVNSSGNRVGGSSGNVGTSTSVVSIPVKVCDECKGKGRVFGQGILINSNRY
jgi:hypothetical protein